MQTIDLLAWLLEKKLFLTATCLGFPNGCGFFCKPQRGFNVLGSRILLGPCCLSVQGFLQNSYTYKPLILDLLWYSFLIIGENQEQTSKNIIVTEKKKNMRRKPAGEESETSAFFFQVKGDVDLAEPSQLRALSVRTSELPELLPLGHGLSTFVASSHRKPPCNSTPKVAVWKGNSPPYFHGNSG